MSKILEFSITQLRNEELLGFSREQWAKIEKLEPIRTGEKAVVFEQKLKAYRNELDAENELQYKDLTAADAVVCSLIRHFKDHVQIMMIYPDAEASDAAKQVWKAIDQYDQLPKKSFTDQYAVIERMLDQLEAQPAERMQKAQVALWVPEIRKAVDQFMQKQSDYDNAKAEMPMGRIKAARQALIEAWRDMVEFINSYYIILPNPDVERLINQMNSRIQRAKNSMRQHRLNKGEEESGKLDELEDWGEGEGGKGSADSGSTEAPLEGDLEITDGGEA